MNLARTARLAGAAWEVARIALLLSAAARLAGGRMAGLVPLLVPLAAPGLVMAAGFAAAAMLAGARAALRPLLRLGKALELASGLGAIAAAFIAGIPPELALILLLGAATAIDLMFLLFMLSSDGSAPAPDLPGPQTAQGADGRPVAGADAEAARPPSS